MNNEIAHTPQRGFSASVTGIRKMIDNQRLVKETNNKAGQHHHGWKKQGAPLRWTWHGFCNWHWAHKPDAGAMEDLLSYIVQSYLALVHWL
jgi:hypothetical protein